jgi:hypothetical protein
MTEQGGYGSVNEGKQLGKSCASLERWRKSGMAANIEDYALLGDCETAASRGKASDLVRIVKGQRGSVTMHTELIMRFDYGALVPWVTRTDDGTLVAISGPDMIVLRTPVAVHGEDRKTVGTFTVSAERSFPSSSPMDPRILSRVRALIPWQR